MDDLKTDTVARADFERLLADYDHLLQAALTVRRQRDRLIGEMLGIVPCRILRDPLAVVVKAADWQERRQ